MNNNYLQQNNLQQSNDGYEKPDYKNKSNKPLILFLVLLLLVLASYIVYDKITEEKSLKNNDETIDSENENDDTTKEDEPVELSISDSLVSSLYATTKTFCSYTRSLYYDEGTVLRSDINVYDLHPESNPDNTLYACDIPETYQTKIISAKQYSDRIEIVEKHIYIVYVTTSENVYKIYAEHVAYNAAGEISLPKLDTIIGSDYSDSLIDNYLDKVPSYTFTFNKQSDGTYLLYSIKKES